MPMRFLLVNPYYAISETPSPPLGLAYIGAALEAAGVHVALRDFVVSPYNDHALQSFIADFSPQAVGVTSVTMTFDEAARVVRDVKRMNPGIFTVMGGPHVTFCAEKTLSALPELDVIVLGEGEETVVDLADAVSNGRPFSSVKGIVFRNGSGAVRTPQQERPVDVNALPLPARHLVPLGRYRVLGMPVSMTTSRGCPFKCIFCVGRKMVGSRVRYRDPEKVVDEMAYLNTLGFRQINIADDLFTASKDHCLGVCKAILDRNLKLDWTAFARVDTVSKNVLAAMKAAGCHTVSFGVESANETILRTVKKGITLKQVDDALAGCIAVGMTPQVSFILGLPGETPETLAETVAYGNILKERGVHHGFHLLAPFPGTEVREKSRQYGIRILTDDWSCYHANRAIVETATVNCTMLDRIVAEWEDRFNEWLGDIKDRMAVSQAEEEEIRQLKQLEHTVAVYDLMMGSVIERSGCTENIASGVPETDALEKLAAAIDGSVPCSGEQLRNSLALAAAEGSLKRLQHDGKVCWEWVDDL